MMSDNKKNRATLIIAKMSKKPKDSESEYEKPPMNERDEPVDSSMGLQSAAEELLAAVESKDAKAVMSAMKSFYDMCASEDEMMESEDDESKPA